MNTIPWGLGVAPGSGSTSVTQVVSTVDVALVDAELIIELVSPQIVLQEEN